MRNSSDFFTRTSLTKQHGIWFTLSTYVFVICRVISTKRKFLMSFTFLRIQVKIFLAFDTSMIIMFVNLAELNFSFNTNFVFFVVVKSLLAESAAVRKTVGVCKAILLTIFNFWQASKPISSWSVTFSTNFTFFKLIWQLFTQIYVGNISSSGAQILSR